MKCSDQIIKLEMSQCRRYQCFLFEADLITRAFSKNTVRFLRGKNIYYIQSKSTNPYTLW